MQLVHLVVVELANHCLQNPCNGVLPLTKKLLIDRTKILCELVKVIKQWVLCNHHRDGHRQHVGSLNDMDQKVFLNSFVMHLANT